MIDLDKAAFMKPTVTPMGTYHYIRLDTQQKGPDKVPRLRDVCVIVPENYVASGRILVHFHGIRQVEQETHGLTPQMTMENFGFVEALHSVAPGMMMVCPIGNKDYYDLGLQWGSVHRILPALADLGEPYSDVTISGHSGAGVPISQILDGGTAQLPVRNVFLFDATYSDYIGPEVKWLRVGPHKRMWSAARAGTTYDNASAIARAAGGANFQNNLAHGDHWKVVNNFFPRFLKESLVPV